jgi:hypothetical protein
MDETDDRYFIPDDQRKNVSSWSDALLGRISTEKFDNYYENLPTKLSNKFYKNKIFSNILKSFYKLYCEIIGPFHILPDFLILGPGACGTTSMLELYLRSHKDILPSKINEITYFNNKHKNSVNWYRLFFPSIFTKKFRKLLGKKTLTGEASGNYILNPNSPKRIRQLIPNVKFIVMLRNPVDRTLSHYKRRIRNKKETRSLDEVIKFELNNFEKEFNDYIKNENNVSLYPATSYLSRSKYSQQLENWFKYFPKNQFLFINSNDYFKNPLTEYNRILDFLDLPPHYPDIKGKRGISPDGLYDKIIIEPKIVKFLNDYFLSWNEKLFNLLNVKYDWAKS